MDDVPTRGDVRPRPLSFLACLPHPVAPPFRGPPTPRGAAGLASLALPAPLRPRWLAWGLGAERQRGPQAEPSSASEASATARPPGSWGPRRNGARWWRAKRARNNDEDQGHGRGHPHDEFAAEAEEGGATRQNSRARKTEHNETAGDDAGMMGSRPRRNGERDGGGTSRASARAHGSASVPTMISFTYTPTSHAPTRHSGRSGATTYVSGTTRNGPTPIVQRSCQLMPSQP